MTRSFILQWIHGQRTSIKFWLSEYSLMGKLWVSIMGDFYKTWYSHFALHCQHTMFCKIEKATMSSVHNFNMCNKLKRKVSDSCTMKCLCTMPTSLCPLSSYRYSRSHEIYMQFVFWSILLWACIHLRAMLWLQKFYNLLGKSLFQNTIQ